MAGSKPAALPLGYTPKKFGEPVGIRTQDTRLRRPLLYPAELRTHASYANVVQKKLERMMRIELTLPAWKAGVLPLNYIRKKCPETESNRRHGDFQSPALPTELSRHNI